MTTSRLAALALLATCPACVDHLLDRVFPQQGGESYRTFDVQTDRAADILFVIDNSGSMAEEQENLARNASSSSAASPPSACDATGFARLRDHHLANPGTDPASWPVELQTIHAECGFIERLQLFDNDFRLGVITTDLHDCDATYGGAPRASVPQRGCLQSSEAEPDLTVLTPTTPELVERFAAIVRNVGTWGSAWEQGLAASQHFLTPGHDSPAAGTCSKARDCAGDLDALLREDSDDGSGQPLPTKLVIVYLTDEDDCSNHGTIDESVPGSTDLCYEQPALLTPVAELGRALRSTKADPGLVSVAVIGGLVDSGAGLQPAGCVNREHGVDATCTPAQGNSVATCDICVNARPVCACHPAIAAADCQGVAHTATNCCQADPATRYVELAQQFATSELASLCEDSYKRSLIEVAALANLSHRYCVDQELDPELVVVVVIHVDGSEEQVPRAGALGQSGWHLDDSRRCVLLTGDWVPAPGEQVELRYLVP